MTSASLGKFKLQILSWTSFQSRKDERIPLWNNTKVYEVWENFSTSWINCGQINLIHFPHLNNSNSNNNNDNNNNNNNNKSSNSKSPGKDKVSNFWLKHLVSLHEDLAKAYTKVIEHSEETPEWLTEGITYLLPKQEETKNPKNYRPITCLPTMYKILTSIIAEQTYTFLNEHRLVPSEQKGCKRGSYGCKDQLLINKMILEDCQTKKKNLSTAWIDYKKAFDSVPHTGIIKCMEIYKICPVTVNFIAESMKCWKTT